MKPHQITGEIAPLTEKISVTDNDQSGNLEGQNRKVFTKLDWGRTASRTKTESVPAAKPPAAPEERQPWHIDTERNLGLKSRKKPAAPVVTGTTGGSGSRRKPTTLPQFLQDMIACPPPAGSGVHQWLFKVARQLHAHRDPQAIVDLLQAACEGCGRSVPLAEIIAAVEDSRICAWQPNGTGATTAKPAPKWPTVDAVKRQAAIEAAGMTLADLREASPTTCTQDGMDAEFFADALFPGNPLLCLGADNEHFETAPRESFRGDLGTIALIVPSPMSALTGTRKSDGKVSAHTLNNTGPRRYLITEFDGGTTDEQAALLWHLRQFAPLVLVLHSGGKSLHGWWDCMGVDEAVALRFFRYAVTLGADKATWSRSQFVRLPQGWRRDKQARQEVLFFDSNCSKRKWNEPPDTAPKPEPPDTTNTRKPLSTFTVDHTATLGLSWEQIDALRPPVVIDGFLRWGEVLLLGAESKSRKSWLAQDAGFAVAGGLPWLADECGENGFATAQARVHVLDLELNASEMRYRFAKARANRFADFPDAAAEMTARIAAYSLDGLNVADIMPLLSELKATVEPGDLVIVDCLYRLCPDGNEVAPLAEILETIKRFATDTKAGVILVDHFRKAGDDKARNRFAGSFVKQASASTLVAIEVTADDVLVLNIDARTFHGCPKVYARFNLETYAFNRLPDVEVAQAKATRTQAEAEGWLLRLWKGRPDTAAIGAADAVECWAVKRQTAAPRLGKLVSRGWLTERKHGHGKATEWTLASEGLAVVKSNRQKSQTCTLFAPIG